MNSRLLNILKLMGGFVGLFGVYIIYRAGKIYLVRRKYRHIPGPPTKGYLDNKIYY